MTITLVCLTRPHPVDGRSPDFSTSPHPSLHPRPTQSALIHPGTIQHHHRPSKTKGQTRVYDVLRRPRQETRDLGHNDVANFLPQELCFPSISRCRTHQTDFSAYRPPDVSSTSKTSLTLSVEAGWTRSRKCRCRRNHLGRSKAKMWAFFSLGTPRIQNPPVETEGGITIAPPEYTRFVCGFASAVSTHLPH